MEEGKEGERGGEEERGRKRSEAEGGMGERARGRADWSPRSSRKGKKLEANATVSKVAELRENCVIG